jgi:hypothetical protein
LDIVKLLQADLHSFGCMPRSGTVETSILISIVAALVYTPLTKESPFSASLPAFVVCFLDDCHCDWSGMKFQWF